MAMTQDQREQFDRLKSEFTLVSESIRIAEANLHALDDAIAEGGSRDSEADRLANLEARVKALESRSKPKPASKPTRKATAKKPAKAK